MAGETAIVYEQPTPPLPQDAPAEIPTTWLVALWITAAAVAAGGLTWALLAPPFLRPSAVVVHGLGVMTGGPLFMLTWVWLAGADGCHHRPFVGLAAVWVVMSLPQVLSAIAGAPRVGMVILGGLPLVSSILVLWLVLGVRSRQARAADALSGWRPNA